MTVDEFIEHEGRFYILTGPAPPDPRTLVLKHGETFGVFNFNGDIDRRNYFAQGLFTDGMRYLSRLEVRVEQQRLLLLSSKVSDDNTRILVDLTNPDIQSRGKVVLPHGSLHVARSIFLWAGTCFERLTLSHYGLHAIDVVLSMTFESDFADIFELRGTTRQRRGVTLEPEVGDNTVVLGYAGLDGVTRRAHIHCAPQPDALNESEFRFAISLQPREKSHIEFTVRCEPASSAPTPGYDDNASRLLEQVEASQQGYCVFESSSEQLSHWIARSLADIRTLMTHTKCGPYPYAGIPWYSTVFGRDGIITALQLLWVNPDVAKGVLTCLAATQARSVDPVRDAEPGKILHERRTDEMAAIGEVPFAEYYGSVDATPLFVVLACAYFEATGDSAFIESIWPSIELALKWIDEMGDVDGDGFVEYQSKTEDGLANQGWKDSHDAIFHADGTLATPPIALCEVQGYVYDAKVRTARLARVLGRLELAERLSAQAHKLKQQFQEAFWCDDLGTYAIALDGRKRACKVRTSNAGHCLFSGIADEQQAHRVRDQLLSRSMFSGWAIRTVDSNDRRYNPMSYHNGSIWPHDSALIAAGFARYGMRSAALRVFRGWFNAAGRLDMHRLPELCCGFRRRKGKGPTLYPVACSPQAWAAGSVFMMLGACLGISVDGVQRRVQIHRPRLPRAIGDVQIRNLRVGNGEVDLLFHRDHHDVGVLVQRKDTSVDVVVRK